MRVRIKDVVEILEDDYLMMITKECQKGRMVVVDIMRNIVDEDDVNGLREIIIRREDRKSFEDVEGKKYRTVSVLEDMVRVVSK